MRLRPLIATALVGLLATGTATAVAAPGKKSQRSPSFAPASTATVKPGVQTFTSGSQCTANFVFQDGAGSVYLGQSAHCASLDGPTATNGCTAKSLPLGTQVRVTGASKPGVLAYSSWLSMQRAGEKDLNACRYNDFALVRLDPSDVSRTNPSVPFFGGPVALDTDGTRFGDTVVSYGNSSLRFGLSSTSPKRGVSRGTAGEGWTHSVYTVTPGIPGDSGSAVMDGSGRAIGTLSTLSALGDNGVSDLSREIAYARTSVPGLALVPGTEAFRGVL